MPTLRRAVTVVAISLLQTLAFSPAAEAAASLGPVLPNQAAEPGTTHGVILPGVVELKGNAAWPQHPLEDPRDAAASTATMTSERMQTPLTALPAVEQAWLTKANDQITRWQPADRRMDSRRCVECPPHQARTSSQQCMIGKQ